MARPKKAGKREPNGRLKRSEPDKGTPETQARRRWFAGSGDQNLTSFPLGILRTNNQISKEQFENGCKLAWLYAVVFGRANLGAKGSGKPTLPDDPEWYSARQRDLNRSLEALELVSIRLRNIVVDICVFERQPRWLGPTIPTLEDYHDARLFLFGLTLLRKPLKGVNYDKPESTNRKRGVSDIGLTIEDYQAWRSRFDFEKTNEALGIENLSGEEDFKKEVVDIEIKRA